MTLSLLVIPLGFILLAAVLCWQLIGDVGKWWHKLVTIICVPAFGLAMWASIGSYMGWPTDEKPPAKSLLLGAEVREPLAQQNEEGAIYVWLINYDARKRGLNPLDYAPKGNEPRVYKLPYSKTLHEKISSARESMSSGKPMVFSFEKKESKQKGRFSGRRQGGVRAGDGDSYGPADGDEGEVGIYELPPPSTDIKSRE